METNYYEKLCVEARVFAQLDTENIHILHAIAADISPRLHEITDKFFLHLLAIPRLQPFLDGRLEQLKLTHEKWLKDLLWAQFDAKYTEEVFDIGGLHGKIQLPAEFMAGAMSIIQGHFIGLLRETYADQPELLLDSVLAINAALGFSLYIMQGSYQSSSVANEMERFLTITGMSQNLFDNLARAQRQP